MLYLLAIDVHPNLHNVNSISYIPKTLGKGCTSFRSPSLLSHSPPIIHKFHHQNISPKNSIKPHACTHHIVIVVSIVSIAYVNFLVFPNVTCYTHSLSSYIQVQICIMGALRCKCILCVLITNVNMNNNVLHMT